MASLISMLELVVVGVAPRGDVEVGVCTFVLAAEVAVAPVEARLGAVDAVVAESTV
jgi:hypothetical protein